MKPTSYDKSFKQTLFLAFALACPFLILCIMGVFNSQLLQTFDTSIGQLFYKRGPESLLNIVINFTKLGNPKSVIILVLIVALIILSLKRDWKSSLWYILTVLLGASILNSLVKNSFQRIRPALTHLIEQDGFSFPSGHAMGAVIYFGALTYLFYYYSHRSPKNKLMLISLTIIFALLMGISRLYLGVHYPSDILGGYSLGSAFLILAIECHRRFFQNIKSSQS